MQQPRILVVDDDLSASRLLKLILERSGPYEVREENNSKRALAAAREFKPDLIVLDVCMPDLDGGDLAFQMRADATLRNTPIIFLTSLVSENDAGTEALLAGGYHFLSKPVNVKRLTECIEKNLFAPSVS